MFPRRLVTSTPRKPAGWSQSLYRVSGRNKSAPQFPRRLALSSSHNLRGSRNLSGQSGVSMMRRRVLIARILTLVCENSSCWSRLIVIYSRFIYVYIKVMYIKMPVNCRHSIIILPPRLELHFPRQFPLSSPSSKSSKRST